MYFSKSYRIYGVTFVVAWCPMPILANGTISHLSQNCPNGQCRVSTRASFSCNPEYHLTGNGQVTCAGYGEWNPAFPICEGKPVYISQLQIKKLSKVIFLDKQTPCQVDIRFLN